MKFSIKEITLFERDVRLRMPFRFGVVTLTEAPQAFVRCCIRTDDGREPRARLPSCWRPWFIRIGVVERGQFRAIARILRRTDEVSRWRHAHGQTHSSPAGSSRISAPRSGSRRPDALFVPFLFSRGQSNVIGANR
jgi:hypothetical protein